MSLDNEDSHGEIPQENRAEMVKKWADPEHYKMEGVETIKIIEWFVSNPKRKLTEEQKKSKKYVSKLLNDGFVYEDAEEAESYYVIDGSVGVNNFLRIYTPEDREHALVKAFDEKS